VHAFVQDRDSSERRAPSPSKEMSKRPGNGKCPCPCESLELNSMRWSKFDPLYKLLGWSKNVFIPKIQFGTTVSLFSFPIRGSHHATSSSPSPPQIGKKLGGRRARHAPCTPPPRGALRLDEFPSAWVPRGLRREPLQLGSCGLRREPLQLGSSFCSSFPPRGMRIDWHKKKRGSDCGVNQFLEIP
jgi:hypothetical protein